MAIYLNFVDLNCLTIIRFSFSVVKSQNSKKMSGHELYCHVNLGHILARKAQSKNSVNPMTLYFEVEFS